MSCLTHQLELLLDDQLIAAHIIIIIIIIQSITITIIIKQIHRLMSSALNFLRKSTASRSGMSKPFPLEDSEFRIVNTRSPLDSAPLRPSAANNNANSNNTASIHTAKVFPVLSRA